MTKDDALLTTIDVPLKVPVPVQGADGKKAERSTLTIHRPKVRHTKKLAAMIGTDVLDALLTDEDGAGDGEASAAKVGGRDVLAKVAGRLLTEERLDGLTALIAEMCREEPAVIDDLDLVDLVAVGTAFLRFFPALQSAASSAWLQILDTPTDGFPRT